MNNNTGHKKYYNRHGMEVPSVTTILKILNNNLDGWANYMGLKGINTKHYVSDRAEYGSYVHSLCEKFFKGELPDNIEEFKPNEDFLSMDGFKELHYKLTTIVELFNRRGFTYKSCELPSVTDTFGGTIDLILYNESTNEHIIIDFKTSKQVYLKYFIQLAGYTLLTQSALDYKISAVGIILIDKPITDTNFITLRRYADNAYNMEIFTHLLNIYYSMTEDERRFYYG